MLFEEHRTFLTEFTNEEEDNEDDEKTFPSLSMEQTNSVNELMKNNYVLQVLDIKKMTTTSSKRDQTKSVSEKGSYISRKGNITTKKT
jgi:hypothetical protein